MKVWNKPQVREQEVGLEVTSYLPAEALDGGDRHSGRRFFVSRRPLANESLSGLLRRNRVSCNDAGHLTL